jgi:hypothetical protein
MKRLVLLGEGHGEVDALPILVGRLLAEKSARGLLYLDRDIIREGPASLVKWDKRAQQPDYSGWIRRVELAARRRDVGGILAVYDGDAAMFPAGSTSRFCARTAAVSMAAAAASGGAGKMFSLAVVFACAEYETWLIAGIESLAGRRLSDGRIAIPADVEFPGGDAESHGKGWLIRNCPGYRPTRDQARLTELLDFNFVRAKKLGSFERLEHALDQLLGAVAMGIHVSTPG